MTTVLFANEVGRGFGHVRRLAALAAEAKRRGWRTVLAAARLSFVGDARGLFDHVVPAPFWPGLVQESWFETGLDRSKPANSFAPIIIQLGAADPRALAAHLLAWDGLFHFCKPDAVIGDYAPGAHLAAWGRIPSVSVGTGFTVPDIVDGRFALFREHFPGDDPLQDRLANVIPDVMTARGLPAPGQPLLCVRGERGFPICLAALDAARKTRVEKPLPPDLARQPRNGKALKAGKTGVYLGPDIGPYRKSLEIIAEVWPGAEIYAEGASGAAAAGSAGLKVRSLPFSAPEIAKHCRMVVHHGGLGIAQLCAAAGVPQFILFSDTEKWLNAEAVMARGAGVGLPLHLAKAGEIRQAARFLDDPAVTANALTWQRELPAKPPHPSAEAIIADAVAGFV